MRASKRQVLLFVAAVAAPCLVVAVLVLLLMGQERELAEKRRQDEQRLAVERVRGELLARLERIKLEAVAARESHPAVVFAAWVREGRLVLPWESAGPLAEVLRAAYFEPHIRAGERAEFAEGRLAEAIRAYASAAAAARVPAQLWYARLLRARALDKAGRSSEALAGFRAILAAPSGLSDEEGVPLALCAAERLAGVAAERDRVLPVAREALDRGWLPPSGNFLLSTIAQRLGALGELVAARIREAGQAAGLQAEFPRLGLRPEGEPSWVLYGTEPWLVSGAPPDRLVAVRAAPEFQTFGARGVHFAAAHEARGELLGLPFPNLKAEVPGAPAADSGLRRRLYWATLLAVVGVALSGAWLLWRDLRREARLAELQGQFVASVSHELKTPLTAIRMYAETLQMGRSRDPETEAEYLATIVNECERLTRLVDGVLQFSKLEQGKRTFHMRPVPLERPVYAAAQAIEYPLEQKGFALKIDIEEGLPPVKADADALEQAVLNLLSNAMKFSGESRRIELSVRAAGGHAAIAVRDYGIGIAREEQARIFDKFYRAPGSAVPGTGLGLTLVARIARAHAGEVRVESEPGQGSTFTILLPLGGSA